MIKKNEKEKKIYQRLGTSPKDFNLTKNNFVYNLDEAIR
jgi:hypothetical protein